MNNHNEALVLNEDTVDYLADGPLSPSAVIATAKDILASQVRHTDVFSSPNIVADYLVIQFAGLEHEVFA